ncbi:HAD family hydrolase [Aquihabitans sp. G128]|uniref:HAD family hydrolase n=1 Tax=Aquihabitans sp. G128 TaxID=2849779 RepID=UPI001C23468C|nr:HAD family hydrolase [Aquihabitans sp. G128]QXC59968.1 HAD family hydrolase [Aquihabitans sp. G128]
MRSTPPRAVTFDFWNTLIRADDAGVRDRRLAAWLGLLAGEGYEVDQAAIAEAMAHAGRRFDDGWLNNRIYVAHEAVADMVEHLGIDAPPDLRAQLLASITDPDPAHDPQPAPGVGDALEALRLADIRIGIICDVGLAPSSTLRRYLATHGLLDAFDHVSFSDEVGVFKPDPAIFRHALAGLGGIDPADAAHIGDLRRTDVAGALAMGIYAIRYTGVYDDPGSVEAGTDGIEGDAVVDDYADLPAVLALA